MDARSIGGIALVLLAWSGSFATAAVRAGDHLPPALEWEGASRNLVAPSDHPWITPAEANGFGSTPTYDETVAWLERAAAASPDLSMVDLGPTAEGRTLWLVLASRAATRTPGALAASGLPIVLVQAGIHAGEIDGKDAGLMLLRDLALGGRLTELLDRVHLLFLPMVNPDGHERRSPFSRMNQRGPEPTGWRTNARNLNLNRDYTKLETEEIRAVVELVERWQPDLYLDLHVTDGADYQYDVTWGTVPPHTWSPDITEWTDRVLGPALTADLEAQGHVPGPFVWARNGMDMADGALVWVGSPRFSNVYGAVRHLPTILVENHSLKPYEQRVLGTYVFLESTLRLLAREVGSLREAVAKDRAARPSRVVLDWETGEEPTIERRPFAGVRSERVPSEIAGVEIVRWTGEPVEMEVDFVIGDEPAAIVDRPAAYLVPPAWSDLVEKLERHGIRTERLTEPTTVEVEQLRLPDAGIAGGGSAFDDRSAVYEGRIRVDPGAPVVERVTLELPAGTVRVPTDQPLGDLAILLLEPESPDSFLQWGYLLNILTRTEYFEPYAFEPIAREMLAADPDLATAFEQRLAEDPAFAADPKARLEWFYRRTPYYDQRHLLYPIVRVPASEEP